MGQLFAGVVASGRQKQNFLPLVRITKGISQPSQRWPLQAHLKRPTQSCLNLSKKGRNIKGCCSATQAIT